MDIQAVNSDVVSFATEQNEDTVEKHTDQVAQRVFSEFPRNFSNESAQWPRQNESAQWPRQNESAQWPRAVPPGR